MQNQRTAASGQNVLATALQQAFLQATCVVFCTWCCAATFTCIRCFMHVGCEKGSSNKYANPSGAIAPLRLEPDTPPWNSNLGPWTFDPGHRRWSQNSKLLESVRSQDGRYHSLRCECEEGSLRLRAARGRGGGRASRRERGATLGKTELDISFEYENPNT